MSPEEFQKVNMGSHNCHIENTENTFLNHGWNGVVWTFSEKPTSQQICPFCQYYSGSTPMVPNSLFFEEQALMPSRRWPWGIYLFHLVSAIVAIVFVHITPFFLMISPILADIIPFDNNIFPWIDPDDPAPFISTSPPVLIITCLISNVDVW